MGVLKNVWSVKEVVEIRELSGNMYAISFVDKQSMKMALEGGPWSVMGSCLNLKKWEIDQAIHDISFSKVIFWIQIHKLPFELMTLQNVRKIGQVLGELIKAEDPVRKKGVGRSFLRVRVEVDVEKPLVAGFWVLRGDKGRVWAEIKYERIADFCFRCGRLGHVLRNCEEEISGQKEIRGKKGMVCG